MSLWGWTLLACALLIALFLLGVAAALAVMFYAAGRRRWRAYRLGMRPRAVVAAAEREARAAAAPRL